jgi:hypothetical protein
MSYLYFVPEIKTDATAELPTATQSIHLQYVGQQAAILVSELRPGYVMVWNSGAMTEVVSIEQISPKFVNIMEREVTYKRKAGTVGLVAVRGKTYDSPRRFKLDRLIGYSRSATAELAAQVEVETP